MIRDVLHEAFLVMSESGWPLSACEAFSQYLANSVMNEDNPKLPDGLKLHMADIFMPELRKVSLEKVTWTLKRPNPILSSCFLFSN